MLFKHLGRGMALAMGLALILSGTRPAIALTVAKPEQVLSGENFSLASQEPTAPVVSEAAIEPTFVPVSESEGISQPLATEVAMEAPAVVGVAATRTEGGGPLKVRPPVANTLFNTAPIFNMAEFTPADGAVNVPTTTVVVLRFSNPVDPSTVSGTSLQIRNYDNSHSVTSVRSYSNDNTTVTITPVSPLEYNKQYYIYVSTSTSNIYGSHFAEDWSATNKAAHEFTTEKAPIVLPRICKGDMNNDGVVNFQDINNYQMVYHYPDYFQQHDANLFWQADLDGNNQLTGSDLNTFVNMLSHEPRELNCHPSVPDELPGPETGLKGDVNNDGVVNFQDLNPFRMVYDYANYFKTNHHDLFWRADIDDSASVDGTDINSLVMLLSQPEQ